MKGVKAILESVMVMGQLIFFVIKHLLDFILSQRKGKKRNGSFVKVRFLPLLIFTTLETRAEVNKLEFVPLEKKQKERAVFIYDFSDSFFKDEIFKKNHNDRKITVQVTHHKDREEGFSCLSSQKKSSSRSVKQEDEAKKKEKQGDPHQKTQLPQLLCLRGRGRVAAPLSFSFDQSRQVERLEKESLYIKSIKRLDPKTFEFITQALGYEAHFWIVLDHDEKEKQVQFEIFKGSFKGLKGSLQFLSVGTLKTEIQFFGQMEFVELPAPAFFMSFAFEVVLQKMSEGMRSLIEEDFKKNKSTVL